MEILGLGSDLVECVKIGKLLAKHGETFLERFFTAREIRECQAKKDVTEQFAARWAAKDAVLQSIGLAPNKATVWTDIEVRKLHGEWKVFLGGSIKEHARTLRVADIRLTLAKTRPMAVAFAIALTKSP